MTEKLPPDRAAFESNRCIHCGGAHLRACPRVRRMRFHVSGELHTIEFWPEYDDSNIIWPEDVYNGEEVATSTALEPYSES